MKKGDTISGLSTAHYSKLYKHSITSLAESPADPSTTNLNVWHKLGLHAYHKWPITVFTNWTLIGLLLLILWPELNTQALKASKRLDLNCKS